MPKLGIIAGSGRFPLLLANAARADGWEIVVFGVEDESLEPELLGSFKTVYRLRIEQVGRLIELLHEENIRDAVMAGKVIKRKILGDLKPDARTIRVLLKLKDHADDSLLGAVTRELESEGIHLHPSASFIKELLAPEGTLTGNAPTEKEWGDIRYGWRIAKEMGRVDVGQTVVVKDKAVIAVEAIEGTDEAIKRSGALAGAGVVVVKVAKPQQDTRFDMPTVGLNTIESMISVKARVLAIEAGWTVLLDRNDTIKKADAAGIVLVSCKDPLVREEGR